MPVPRQAKRKLRNLVITNVDIVTMGANQDAATGDGARVALWKSADVDKRDFSTDQRGRMADRGQAMPDGSFPIANRQDLLNAIRAVGRAKDPAAAKRHIVSRARALGLTSLLPDGWTSSSSKSGRVPDDSSRGAGHHDDEGGRSMPQGRDADRGDQGGSDKGEPRYTEAEWRARLSREQGTGDEDKQGRENANQDVLGEGLDDLEEGTREREVRERTGQYGSQGSGRDDDFTPGSYGEPGGGSPGGRNPANPGVADTGRQSEDPKKAAKSVAEALRRAADAEARAERLEKAWNERQEAEAARVFKSKAESFGVLGDVDDIAAVLKACAGAGKDLYARAEQMFQVAAARVAGSTPAPLFGEMGTTKGSTAAAQFGAEGGELVALAQSIAKQRNITVEAATVEAIEQRPDLYGEYQRSNLRR